ncbi:MAG: hypothetical protein A2176_00760 [Spirochaetes bacterium RBG_13_51_14]|nr:MAG: hypothetical protein A2176_00760 [Spirochaetes bacterium RBG_13_51_14]
MKKVLLINTNTEKNPYPVPPLGLCLIAAALENEYDVRVYDGAFDGGENLIRTVSDFRPDYVGVSIRNIDDMDILNPTNYIEPILNSFIRPIREATAAPVILGGSAFSIFPEYFMKYYGADFGVFGEGEEAFRLLLRCLESSGDPSTLPGIYARGSTGCTIPAMNADLTNLPFSEIDLKIDYAPYRARGSYPVQTKRGCIHRCIYCTYNCIEGFRYRTRPPARIADELEQAAGRLGHAAFEFVDSTFNDPAGHAEAVCREIARRKIKARLRTMGINPCNATAELFELMLAAGFAQIDCTPDTASPRMLLNLRKNFTVAELRETARLVRAFDNPTMWFFIFGGPGETEDTIRETFDFIDASISGKDMIHMTFGLRIYPGTDLHQRALDDGVLGAGDSLIETRFYISKELGRESLFRLIEDASSVRPNCVPVTESNPSPDMMREAIRMREEGEHAEPMFRTLLRLRYRMFGKEMK